MYLLGNGSGGVQIGHLTATGALDSSFGTSGWYAINANAFPSAAFALSSWDLELGPNSLMASFVVHRGNNSSQFRVGLARLPRTGQGSPVLGETSVADIVQYEVPLVPRSDGSAALAFIANSANGTRLVLSQFLPDGVSEDPNFGQGGTIIVPGVDSPYDMAEDELKRLVLVSGTCQVLRRTKAGAPDTSFATGGMTTVKIGDYCASSRVLLQKDRRILVGGTRTIAGSTAVVLVRLWQ